MLRKKACVVIALILCLSVLFACRNTVDSANDMNTMNNVTNNDSQLEGGTNSRVVCTYFFDSYYDYQSFYNIFIDYNTERYVVPNDSNEEFEFEYVFVSEGVELSDYMNKRFDIDFDYQTMHVNITYKADKNYRVEGICLVADETTKLDNIKYEITENDGKILSNDGRKFLLNVYSNEKLIYIGRIDNSVNLKTVNDVSEKLLNYFIIGVTL